MYGLPFIETKKSKGTVMGEMTARGRDHMPSGPAHGTVRERRTPMGHKNKSITLSRVRSSAHPIDDNALLYGFSLKKRGERREEKGST